MKMRQVLLLVFLFNVIRRMDAAEHVGCLKTRWHRVTGDVYKTSPTQLSVENFNYDGLGPGGVYWNIGNIYLIFYASWEANIFFTLNISSHLIHFLILALDGYDKFSYIANRIEIRTPKSLDGRGAYNDKNMKIQLPSGVDADDIRWLSVWCDDFKISFGDVVFNSRKERENSCPSAS